MKLWNRKKYITARAIIIRDGTMLAFHRKRKDSQGEWIEYYSIPGGQIEKHEKPEQAVVRELREEMGIKIKPHGLVSYHKGKVFEHYVYYATITEGKPHFMHDSEEAMRYVSSSNQYHVVWVDINSLTKENLKFYAMFLPHIQALAKGIEPSEVQRIGES